ncbi:hypothetical protein CYMTET_35990 [Cymbomonas tetramitiformis]|uniref:Uncharacterized protein n=1 Tax=Cymbomonas tetramitiformis TaxID=36881 RepID=A0AAE0KN13_9CHLO|nr:hypothetical protein CYMTET_35990 [Cymbomonas tetramitiformis]
MKTYLVFVTCCVIGFSTFAHADVCSSECEDEFIYGAANCAEEGSDEDENEEGDDDEAGSAACAAADPPPDEQPSVPTECTMANAGRCECSSETNFTTYTWWLQGQQRCFTTYHPNIGAQILPVLFLMQCYACDTLSGLGMNRLNAAPVEAARRYGFAAVGLSTQDSDWTFANDGVVNRSIPQACGDEYSKDYVYLRHIMEFLEASTDFDHTQIYTSGFSQNSMFAAYAAFCFESNVVGIWQAGSGMVVRGKEPNSPQLEAECSSSSHKAHGTDCRDIQPCTACEYWPIYPCHSTTKPMIDCLMMYTNDFLSGTDDHMYDYLITEGHDARLLKFEPAENIAGGHSAPQQQYDWLVGCLGITAACTQECETSFGDCVTRKQASGLDVQRAFSQCIQTDFSTLTGCESGCSPTLPMLEISEVLVASMSHTENFGGSAEGSEAQPDGSICIVGSTQYDDQAASPPPGAENDVEATSPPPGAENDVEAPSPPPGADNDAEATSPPPNAENEEQDISPPSDSIASTNGFLAVSTIIPIMAVVWLIR